MKKINILLVLICTILFATNSNAQNAVVPNGGFEKWGTLAPGAPEGPTGWISSDIFAFAFKNIKSGSATKTADKKSGSSAILLKRDVVKTATSADTVIGLIFSGDFLAFFQNDALGFASKTRPSALTGFYKFVNPDKDTANIFIACGKYDAAKKMSDEVGFSELFITTPATAFTAFTAPIKYDAKLKGIDTINIIITCSTGGKKSLKTELTVDDLGLTYPVSTDEFEAVPISIYPNPAFEYAYFDFSAISAAKNIELFDIQGRLVNTSVIENNLFQLSLADFSTGTYVYKVTDAKNNLVKTGKIEVLK